jgi:opacity protein-like surface antigen
MKKRMAVFVGLICGLLLVSGFGYSQGVSIFGKALYFYPLDKDFQDIYGGGLSFGGELGIPLFGGVDLWMGASVFQQKGELTFTREETILRIYPISAGLRFRLTRGAVQPYLGAGVGYFLYSESNAIGDVEKQAVGFVGRGGLHFYIAKGFLIDLCIEYSTCKLTPADFTVNIGGVAGGLALGFVF